MGCPCLLLFPCFFAKLCQCQIKTNNTSIETTVEQTNTKIIINIQLVFHTVN